MRLFGDIITQQEKDQRKKFKYLFFPNTICSNAWDFFVSIFLVYIIFFVTFEIAFIEETISFFFIAEIIITIVFVCDIFYNFNKAFYKNKNQLVTKRSEIACNYLKGWFFVDLLSAFPFFLISEIYKQKATINGIKMVKLLKVMNIVRLFRIFKLIKEVWPKKFQNRGKKIIIKFKKNIERLIIHSFIVLIICHLFACFFYAIPTSLSPNNNWLEKRKLQDKSLFEKYLFSMHWMVETVITVGYGENDLE